MRFQVINKATRSIYTTATRCVGNRTPRLPLVSTNNVSATFRSRILTCPSRISTSSSVLFWRKFYSSPIITTVQSALAATKPAEKTSQYEKMADDKKAFSRLPRNIKPIHYNIELVPNLESLTFVGEQKVSIDVKESSNTVTFNACDLDITSVLYNNSEGKIIQSQSIELNNEDEVATVLFSDNLPVGKGFFEMKFKGEINSKLRGLHRSKYVSPDGTTKYAAVTQFEATDARRCFPCWDEPALKATFDISVTVPKNLVALSNMPVKSESNPQPEFKHLVFETSPIMSTYLVAIVIGEFDYIEDRSEDGILVRVYTPKGKQEQGRHALHVATKVLPYYKSYFDIPYPLPKMDLVAISDFSPAAMENWGLVTYRESYLLVDPENTSANVKQNVALTVGHELAHQWFGNLVTMEWWTHLWLNEGYATFVEFLCVDLLFPEYDIWKQFVTETYMRALELDALKNSHPIEVPVRHPSEIDEIFDSISYNKGASVIRMLHSFIGDEDFRKGMHEYLLKHSYANAQTEDLWNALEKVSKKPIEKIMSTWTKQQGFPLLRISEKPSSDPNKRVLNFTQSRFLADGSEDPENKLWLIPISISTSESPEKSIKNEVLDTKTKDIEFEGVPKSSWFKVNPGTVGVYRTVYDSNLLDRFIPNIQNQTLPPLDRLGLLSDLFAVSQAGHVSLDVVLKLMKAYENEKSYTVWSSIVSSLNKIGQLISHLEIYSKYLTFGQSLLKNIYNDLGWDPKPNESHSDILLRSLILNRMICFKNEEAIKEAVRRFENHVTGKEILPADLRSSVYRAVISVGDQNTFETMIKLYKNAELHEEKERILASLGAAEDEDIIKRYLDFSFSNEVKPQDILLIVGSIAIRTYKGRVLAWEFFKDNCQKFIDLYKSGFLLTRLVKCTTENFVDESRAVEIEEFFKKHPIAGTERNVQQSIETVRLNAAWLKRDINSIESFLKNF